MGRGVINAAGIVYVLKFCFYQDVGVAGRNLLEKDACHIPGFIKFEE